MPHVQEGPTQPSACSCRLIQPAELSRSAQRPFSAATLSRAMAWFPRILSADPTRQETPGQLHQGFFTLLFSPRKSSSEKGRKGPHRSSLGPQALPTQTRLILLAPLPWTSQHSTVGRMLMAGEACCALCVLSSEGEGHLLACTQVGRRGRSICAKGSPSRGLSASQGLMPQSLPCLVRPSCHLKEHSTVEMSWHPAPVPSPC